MNPSNSPEIPFQPTHGPAANRMGALSSINQRQKIAPRTPIPAPAPSAAATPPKRLNTGIKTNAEVYPQGRRPRLGREQPSAGPERTSASSRGRSNQVSPGSKEADIRLDTRIFPNPPSDTATRTTDLHGAQDSRHARSGFNTGAPSAKAPNSVSIVSPTNSDKGGSRGRSSQVLPGPKGAEIRLDSRKPPNPPSDTATHTIDLDKAKDSRHARSGFNIGDPGAKGPNHASVISITKYDMGGSRGRSSQVPPGSKEAGIRVDSQIPANPPPNTAPSGVDQIVTTEFRGVTLQPRGSDGENQSSTPTTIE